MFVITFVIIEPCYGLCAAVPHYRLRAGVDWSTIQWVQGEPLAVAHKALCTVLSHPITAMKAQRGVIRRPHDCCETNRHE